MAPMAYSRIISLCMKMRAASRTTGAVCSLASKSRFSSELAIFDNAPKANLATFRSSFVQQCDKTSNASCIAPDWPSSTRMHGSVARFPKMPHASFTSDLLSLKVCMPWIVVGMTPRSTISCRYAALRLRLRMMPKAASWSSALLLYTCNADIKDVSHPEAKRAACTSPQSVAHVQIAEATLARTSADDFEPSWFELYAWLSNAAINASTPPLLRTMMLHSSLTAKLQRKRQTAITMCETQTFRFSKSTSATTLPLCERTFRWRVRFAMSANVVIASSSTTALSRCFCRSSKTSATIPKRLIIASELSTMLSGARTSKQHFAMSASLKWLLSKLAVEDNKPFWIIMLSAEASRPRSRERILSRARMHNASSKSSWALSHDTRSEAKLLTTSASSS
mmetsp:Transcript_88803/g.250141  ORF Transcript_88803/g.250141 Transcript_88803/m.250141 type:complete len:395 (-) Transcript_88803:237-1421(-)